MSQKRRDNKNRILRDGESQRKDGRYVYKYKDLDDKNKFIYSWKLVETDKVPTGKRDCVALRVQIKEIQKKLDSYIIGKTNLTVLELCQNYYNFGKGKKKTSQRVIAYAIKKSIQETYFGKMKIDKVTRSDAKAWCIYMSEEKKYAYSSVQIFYSRAKSAFNMAVEDRILSENPFRFQLKTVVRDDTQPKVSLTPKQEAAFLSFVKTDIYYHKNYNEFYILLNTGLRIAEFLGLTVNDINFEKNYINVSHQLVSNDNEFYIQSPKSKQSYRKIPMSKGVRECMLEVINRRNSIKDNFSVDEYSDFLFISYMKSPKDGYYKPRKNSKYSSTMKRAMKRFLEKYPDPTFPKLTPHVCRHTFCTKMAMAGMNPKALQTIMGHSSIEITMEVYTHLNESDIFQEFQRVEQNRIRFTTEFTTNDY